MGLGLCAWWLLALPRAYSQAPEPVGKIYWSLNWPHKIQRSNLDGSDVEDVVTGLAYPHGLAVDMANGKLYWSDSSTLTDRIQRSNLDGSSVEEILEGHVSWGLAVDAASGKLYWSDMNTKKIHRSDLDGGHVEDVVPGPLESPAGLALDAANGWVYWSDNLAGKVQRAKIGGSLVEDVVANLSYPQGLALDAANGKLYWTDSGTFRLQRAGLDGSPPEDVFPARLKDPYAVAVDPSSGALYWSSVGTSYDRKKGPSDAGTTGRIQRSALDGSGVEDLVSTGRQKVFALALALPGRIAASSCPAAPGSAEAAACGQPAGR